MLDKTLFKIISVCSVITGCILGFMGLLPIIFWYVVLAQMILVAPFMIIYLSKTGVIGELKMDKFLIMGAISGFMSAVGFSVVFLPVAFLLYMIFKVESFLWIKVLFFNFGFVIPMIIFIALLSALINMFSGFLTMYFYTGVKKNK